jgi:hypothetical protein
MLRAGTVLLILLSAVVVRSANAADQEVCDTEADFALGQEDYSNAVIVLRKN